MMSSILQYRRKQELKSSQEGLDQIVVFEIDVAVIGLTMNARNF